MLDGLRPGEETGIERPAVLELPHYLLAFLDQPLNGLAEVRCSMRIASTPLGPVVARAGVTANEPS